MRIPRHHPTWSNLARRGIDKHGLLSSRAMRAYRKKYEEAGYKYNDSRKEHYYEFIARTRLRRKNK